jgi:SAM-dependent methyltransferase
LPFEDNKFDIVVSIETLEHLKNDQLAQYFKEIKRVAKQGGMIFISTPNKNIYSKLHHVNDHYSELTFNELAYMIDSNFSGDTTFFSFGTRVGQNYLLRTKVDNVSSLLGKVIGRIYGLPFPRKVSMGKGLAFWDIKKATENNSSLGYLNIAIVTDLSK